LKEIEDKYTIANNDRERLLNENSLLNKNINNLKTDWGKIYCMHEIEVKLRLE